MGTCGREIFDMRYEPRPRTVKLATVGKAHIPVRQVSLASRKSWIFASSALSAVCEA